MGVPILLRRGGYPISGLTQGGGGTPGTIPPSRPGWGTPHHPDLTEVPSPPSTPGWGTPPHHPDMARVPPHPDLARVTPPPQTWDGVPPHPRPGMGPPEVWTDTQTRVKTLPSLVLRTRAVIKWFIKHKHVSSYKKICACGLGYITLVVLTSLQVGSIHTDCTI